MRQFHLADLFEITAAAVPDRMAIQDGQQSLTFRKLDERTDRLAAVLHDKGVQRGDKVALFLTNTAAYLETFIAAVKLGAVPVNVNYRYTTDELEYLLDNSDSVIVVHDAEFLPQMIKMRELRPMLKPGLCVGDAAPEELARAGSAIYEQLMLAASPEKTQYARDEEDYLLLYTGGTTGMPRGVMWPHKAFFFACLGGGGIYLGEAPISDPLQQGEMAVKAPDLRIFPIAPLMHGAAIWTALGGLLGGITLVLDPMRDGFNAERIWSRVEADKVNILQIVGDAMAMPLLDGLKANRDRWDLSSIYHFGSGGAVFSTHIKSELNEFLPNATMADGMGSSESGIAGMGEPSSGDGLFRLPSGPDQSVLVEDRPAMIGELGTLARSGHTPIGYYKDTVKSAEVFRKIDGKVWVLTGDQARLDADTKITVFGRGSTCINSGGEKIYPEEVEQTLREHAAVYDAIVVGLPDPRWGEAVSAVVSLRPDTNHEINLDEVRQFCKTRLASYKVPRRISIVAEVKRSPAGKQNYKWARSVLQENIENVS